MNCMKLLCLFLLATSLVLADDYDFTKEEKKSVSVDAIQAYNKWKFSNKRAYLSEEEQNFRQLIFLENFQKIQDHNNDSKNTYKVDLNQFSDMTEEEFESKILNPILKDGYKSENQEDDDSDKRKLQTIAPSIDWRTKGVVTPVKNQGQCGSCWAFSVTGLLESVNILRKNNSTQFADQQLVDCCTRTAGFSGSGCNGGWPASALDYVKKFGLLQQSAYPYIGSQSTCKVNTPTTGFYITTSKMITKSADALKAAVNIQPVSIAVHATYWSSYRSGVFTNCSSDPNKANHAVLLVGYTAAGEWIVKNSWGTSWGAQGYITLAPGNTCGVYNYGLVAGI